MSVEGESRAALVTGASRGIGKEIALELARNEWRVAMLPTHFRTPATRILPSDRRQAIDFNGGRDRTRTCDLLRVKQRFLPNSLITEQIFSCKTSP